MHQFKNEERDGSKWALKFDDEIRYLAKENNVFRSQTHTMIHTACRLCELEIRWDLISNPRGYEPAGARY